MCKKLTFFLTVTLIMLGISSGIQAQTFAYAYDGGVGSYGTVDLSTGFFTTINMGIQGSYFPVSADNNGIDEQYAAMSDYSGTSFFLAHMNFTTQTQDSIGPIAPLASGQTQIKALAYNAATDVWYLISGDDFATAAVLYTIDINTGTLTEVGNIQNAAAPITLAIDCDGNAYVVNVEVGASTQAVLYSLDLTTAVATQIGTDLGFPDVTYGGQDMDFNPETGNLYWGAYWSSGFFSEGPSFRQIDVTNGTSTEIIALGEFDNFVSFSVNAICSVMPQTTAYTFNGGVFSYGTIDLTTGAFTTMNFNPQGSSYAPAAGDNNEAGSQYVIMGDFSFPQNYFLWHVDFNAMTGDSIAPVGPLASGQNTIKGMAYNASTNTWYVVSSNDFGDAAYLYTLNITTGALTEVGQIQNADLPVGIAIDCDGNAYIVNIEIGITGTAVLNSLDLTTATATAIGTDLGMADASAFNQDMDFNPENGNLYWCGYWSSGFFSEGGSFRLIDVATGTSTEIAAFGQFENLTGFNVDVICQSLPVELNSFSASVNGNIVSLSWSTASEINNSGFSIERRNNQSGWQSVGFVPGFGTSTEQHSYSYKDANLNAGSYTYRLKQVDYDGTYEYSNEINVEIVNPVGYQLAQNYPNPFNPSTTINFSIPVNEVVNLTVFNALGEQVTVLMNKELTAGHYSVNFNASGLASGIYILRMKAGNFVDMKKMNLLK